MFTWVHLYQWGAVIDVKGDANTKRLVLVVRSHIFFFIQKTNKLIYRMAAVRTVDSSPSIQPTYFFRLFFGLSQINFRLKV